MSFTEAKITLAVDAMGSDKGPEEILSGVSNSLDFTPRDTKFIFFGRNEILSPIISADPVLSSSDFSIRHASEVIGMDEKPIAGIKNKKDSSMALALQSLKDGEADALLSCGNTGCLMAGGTIRLRTLEESNGQLYVQSGLVVRDTSPSRSGANPHPKPFHILQNAILGSNYARVALGLVRPKVGLLTIGTEEEKAMK